MRSWSRAGRWRWKATAGWLVGLVTVTAAPARAQDPVAIVGRAGRIYRSLSSLKADFVQTIEDRSQGDTLSGRGTVVQAGDNYFAMRFSDPPDEAVVVDGKYIWTYTPSTAPNVVYRSPLPADPIYGVNFLAKLLDRPQDRYHATYVGREMISGRSTDVVDLVPISQSISFSRARIWIGTDDGLPRRIELDEGPGARRIVVLTNLRPNAPIAASTFSFKVPSGVRVVEPPA